jgi:predicted AAA+ superfamily ATPase
MNENIWKFRWSRDQLRAMLLEQFETFWARDTGIVRSRLAQVEAALKAPHAIIVSGLRRVGKSTLLAQMAHRLGNEAFYYLNFEDDRFLGFQVADFNDLFLMLAELFGDRRIFLIDEIQNIAGWEKFVRRFMDQGYKFLITGSNASLLDRELGTLLTGRYLSVELFPFSFYEYIQFKKEELPDPLKMTSIDQARLQRNLGDYLRFGGIPDALKYPELPLLRSLFDDVLYRDIAARYRLEAVDSLKQLGLFIMSNPGGVTSYNKLKQMLHLGSVNTISSFIEYMENSWLIFPINVYDYSIKRQQIAPKKIYCIDTGLSNEIGFHFSPDSGKLLENLVFLTLRKNNPEIYYYNTLAGYEVDFYLPDKRQLVQVSQRLDNPATRDREVRALQDALASLPVENALLLNDKNDEAFELNGVPVAVQSTVEWLLDQEYSK